MKALCLFVLLSQVVWTQNKLTRYAISGAYSYLYNPKWRMAEHTFVAARPWIADSIGHLSQGFRIGLDAKLAKQAQTNLGIYASYFMRNCPNSNLPSLHLFVIEPRYAYCIQTRSHSRFYATLSLPLYAMNRWFHEQSTTLESGYDHAFGFGIQTSFHLEVPLKNSAWCPYFELQACPLQYFPDAEVLFNDTKGLLFRKTTAQISGSFGLRYHF